MEQDWISRIEHADTRIELLKGLVGELKKEVDSYTGSQLYVKKLELLHYEVELKTAIYFKQSMENDRQQQEAIFKEKRSFVEQNATDILKRANFPTVAKRPNFPQIQSLKDKAIKSDKGSDDWVNALFDLNLQLK